MDTVSIWRDVLDEMERKNAEGMRSLVIVQDDGDGMATVKDSNPESSKTWRLPLAHGLFVLPGDTVLAVRLGGGEIAILVLRRM